MFLPPLPLCFRTPHLRRINRCSLFLCRMQRLPSAAAQGREGEGVAVDSDSKSDSWVSPDLSRDEGLARHLAKEQLAEEEVLEAADDELARRLASEEAIEAGLGGGFGRKTLCSFKETH